MSKGRCGGEERREMGEVQGRGEEGDGGGGEGGKG